MGEDYITLLSDPTVRAALQEAWRDSQPGVSGGHEEGGFVVRDPSGSSSVIRWPRGAANSIVLPPHRDCRIGGKDIVATFHTHPNTGPDYVQEPADTDIRAVRDDCELKGASYLGEFVISQARIYLISPDGRVREVAETSALLAEG